MAIYDVINEKAVLEKSLVQGSGEGIYYMLEGPQEGGQCEEGEGEGGMVEVIVRGEYHPLEEEGGGEGLTYEVPIPTSMAPAQPATQQVAETVLHTAAQVTGHKQ